MQGVPAPARPQQCLRHPRAGGSKPLGHHHAQHIDASSCNDCFQHGQENLLSLAHNYFGELFFSSWYNAHPC